MLPSDEPSTFSNRAGGEVVFSWIHLQRTAQNFFHGLFRIKEHFNNLARGTAVLCVIAVDGFECLGGLLRRRKAEHPLAIRQKGTGAGMLYHRRFAAAPVAGS